jgi:hypothetical protein
VIDQTGSIYALSEEILLFSWLSIAGAASVVGENTSAIMASGHNRLKWWLVGGGRWNRVIIYDAIVGTVLFYISWSGWC